MHRIIKLVVALVLATSGFLVAGGTTAGAQATQAHRATSVSTASAGTVQRATRTARVRSKQVGPVSFKISAVVSPAGGRKPVKLKYAHKKFGHYKTIRKDKMNRKGVARFGRVSRVGWYIAVVPKTRNYPRTYSSNVVHIYKD